MLISLDGIQRFTIELGFLKGHMINRIFIHSWSFYMKFIKITEGWFDKSHEMTTPVTGVQLEGDLGEILAPGAEISPYIGLRAK